MHSNRFLAAAAALIVAAALPAAAQDAPRAGQAFGDWVFACTAVSETQSNCVLQQTLLSEGDRRPLARIGIAKRADAALVLSALLPLGLDLQQDVIVAIDGAEDVPLTIRRCLRNGCIASTLLAPATVEVLLDAASVSIGFVAGSGQEVGFPLSTNGLSEGLVATGWVN